MIWHQRRGAPAYRFPPHFGCDLEETLSALSLQLIKYKHTSQEQKIKTLVGLWVYHFLQHSWQETMLSQLAKPHRLSLSLCPGLCVTMCVCIFGLISSQISMNWANTATGRLKIKLQTAAKSREERDCSRTKFSGTCREDLDGGGGGGGDGGAAAADQRHPVIRANHSSSLWAATEQHFTAQRHAQCCQEKWHYNWYELSFLTITVTITSDTSWRSPTPHNGNLTLAHAGKCTFIIEERADRKVLQTKSG